MDTFDVGFGLSRNGTNADTIDSLVVTGLSDLFREIKHNCLITESSVPKNKLNWFTTSAFTTTKREGAYFKYARFLALDLDEVTNEEMDKFFAGLEKDGIGYFMYETASSSEEKLKLRVVFELEKEITTIAHFKQVYANTFKPLIKYDKSCNDGVRFFYIPNKTKYDSFLYVEGKKLPVPDYIEPPKEIISDAEIDFGRESAEITIKKLNALLDWLQKKNISITADYDSWYRVGLACVSLKHHGIDKKACLDYFIKFSLLDGKDCLPEHKLKVKFESLWENSDNKVNVGTIYAFAKEKEFPMQNLVFSKEKISLVKLNGKEVYYLAKNHIAEQDLVPLDSECFNRVNGVISRVKMQPNGVDNFELKKSDLFYKDKETKKVHPRYSNSDFVGKFAVIPRHFYYLLGAEREGMHFEKSTRRICEAKHYRLPANPVFNADIHEWIKQLNVDPVWFYTYLYYLPDTSKALPMLYLYGESRAGKTFIAKMFASIWDTPVIEDYVDEDNPSFKETAGSNPIILFDEQLPRDLNVVKRLVTSDNVSVKQKWKGEIYVKGYARLVATENADRPTFQREYSNSKSDNKAILERTQMIRFDAKNLAFIQKIGGKQTTSSWINYHFRNHVAFVQQNPAKFNILREHNDIIVLKTDFKGKDNLDINDKNRRIQEHFYFDHCHQKRFSSKEVIVYFDDFKKSLREERLITGAMLSEVEMRDVLKRILSDKNGIKIDSKDNRRRMRVSVALVNEALESLGMADEIILEKSEEIKEESVVL